MGRFGPDLLLKGTGIKLLMSNIAYCGGFEGGKYNGQGMYLDQQESIQTGQLRDGFFIGNSFKITSSGQITETEQARHRFIEEADQPNECEDQCQQLGDETVLINTMRPEEKLVQKGE